VRGSVAAMTGPLPILLDTDVGTDVDDAIALALVLASPTLDLRAVTTVSGDVGIRGRIAKQLLTVGGRPDVPVAPGVREPVLRQRSFLWIGHEGRGILTDDAPLPLAPVHAVDLLIDIVLREQPHLVMIGPLSNLAVAIMKEPAVIGAIPHLTVMGGLLGPQAKVPLLEYNLCSDAEAAVVVLSAGIPTTLVPLDVTQQVFFTSAQVTSLRRARSRLVQVLCDAIHIWAPLQRSFLEAAPAFNRDIVAFLHDPLTVAVLLDASLMSLQRRRLRPAIVDGVFRFLAEGSGFDFEVAVAVDVPSFIEFLIERLMRLR
jgi:purine nucleosidase